jgi:hypothetical protein
MARSLLLRAQMGLAQTACGEKLVELSVPLPIRQWISS